MSATTKPATWTGYRYKVLFSHTPEDTAFAQWLHQRVTAFTTPNALRGRVTPFGEIPAHLRPARPGRPVLAQAEGVDDVLSDHTGNAACLVVVVGEASAGARVLDSDVRAFRSSGRANRVFAVVADHVPPGDVRHLLPPALIEPGPTLIDARAPAAGGRGREGAYQDLVAGMLGVDSSDLAQREAQMLVFREQSARRVAIGLGILALLAVIATTVAVFQTVRAQRNLALAQRTVEQTLATLDSDATASVWGFADLEQKLIEDLQALQSEIGRSSGREQTRLDTIAALRVARVYRASGNVLRALEITEGVLPAILALASSPDATQEERALALRTAYYIFRDRRQTAEKGNPDELMASVLPVLEAAVTAGEWMPRQRQWVINTYLNKSLWLATKEDHAGALEAAEKGEQLARTAVEGEETVDAEAVFDLVLALDQKSRVLYKLDRDGDAKKAAQEGCVWVRKGLERHPNNRHLTSSSMSCAFDEAADELWAKNNKQARRLLDGVVATAGTLAQIEHNGTEWRAALASAHWRLGELDSVADDNDAALAQFEQAMKVWGEIYREEAVVPHGFDNLDSTFEAYESALEQWTGDQKDRDAARRKALDRFLEVHYSMRTCAEKLGATSSCGRVALRSADRAAVMAEKVDRLPDVIAPLELASTLGLALAQDNHSAKYSENLEHACRVRRLYGYALWKAGRASEAIAPLQKAAEDCRTWSDRFDFDIYLRLQTFAAMATLADVHRATGRPDEARRTLQACVEIDGADCYSKFAEMLEQGVGGPEDRAEAKRVRSLKAFTNLKSFTVPATASSESKLNVPVKVYIFERPEGWPYKGIEDQVKWLDLNRSLVVSQDIRDAFITLEELAVKNNVSFPDLAALAIDAAKD